MPQKKNPDMAELIRGKTGRVYGNLFGLLTVMKSLPLAYNKDLQDKEGMFGHGRNDFKCPLMCWQVCYSGLQVNKEKCKNRQKDFSNATELADYLAGKDLPFREAHEVVGRLKC